MRELTKKVIEAGLVDKNTLQLMEKWKLVNPQGVEELHDPTQEAMTQLVNDIAELVEQETVVPEMRETAPGMESLFQDPLQVELSGEPDFVSTNEVEAVMDEMGRFGFKAPLDIEVGTFIRDGEFIYRIDNVERRYVGETVAYYVCDVEQVRA